MKKYFILIIIALGLGAIYYFGVSDSPKQVLVHDNNEESSEAFLCHGEPCNVILLVSDTLSAKHMGVYGYELQTTPFITEYFSTESIVYQRALSTASWTLPSFASFFRSRYPSEITIGELASGTNALPELLRKGGVDVFAILFKNKNPNLIKESISNLFLAEELSDYNDSGDYSPEMTFSAANKWMEERDSKKDENFFLMIHDVTPHDPYTPPEEYKNLYESSGEYLETELSDFLSGIENKFSETELVQLRKQYDQDVTYFDDLFKEFIEDMPEEIKKSTIIVLTSDHGEAFGEHDIYWHGNSVYDEGLHVPLLVKFPGATQTVVQDAVSLIDLTPTVLSWMNVSYETEQFSGRQLIEQDSIGGSDRLVRSESNFFPARKKIKSITFHPENGGTEVPHEFLGMRLFEPLMSVALRNAQYKVIIQKTEKDSVIEVFDYINDPGEQGNLYDENNEAYQELIDAALLILEEGR